MTLHYLMGLGAVSITILAAQAMATNPVVSLEITMIETAHLLLEPLSSDYADLVLACWKKENRS